MIPTISQQETLRFEKTWLNNGIAIPLSPQAIKFATDFANVVISSFVQDCKQRSQAAQPETKTLLVTE